jgi:hypothetical protein
MQVNATRGLVCIFLHQMSPVFKSEIFFSEQKKIEILTFRLMFLYRILLWLSCFSRKKEHNYIYYSVIVVLGSVVIYYL